MRILFFGTPDYTKSYIELLDQLGEVVGVVTSPDAAAGRGRKQKRPAPALWAEEKKRPLFQPENLRDPKLTEALAQLKADVGIVVAYGKIIPQEIFSLPPAGCLNLHFSILPQFRGASPIESALLCGASSSGVTVQKITQKLDAGDILISSEVTITQEDHFQELFDKLFTEGNKLLEETISLLKSDAAQYTPQDDTQAICCSKIKNQERLIEWSQTAEEVCNRIRAFSGHRTCYTLFNNKKLFLHRASVEQSDLSGEAGTVLQADKKGLVIACQKGAIKIAEIQRENKKKMHYIAFTNGNILKVGDKLS